MTLLLILAAFVALVLVAKEPLSGDCPEFMKRDRT
jgi:hypothetical protein